MKKIVVGIVILLMLLIGVSLLWMDDIVKTAINTVLPRVTKTEASIDSVSVRLLSGKVTLSGIKIANPRGFSNSDVFKLNKVYVKIQPDSIFKDVIIVDNIEVDGAEFLYEVNPYGTNIATLLDNINSFSKQAKQGNDVVNPSNDAGMDKNLFVKEFSFTNAKVSLAAGITKQEVATELSIPKMTLKNIGTQDKGATISEVVAKGLSALSASAIQVMASDNAKNVLKNAGGFLNQIKGIFH